MFICFLLFCFYSFLDFLITCFLSVYVWRESLQWLDAYWTMFYSRGHLHCTQGSNVTHGVFWDQYTSSVLLSIFCIISSCFFFFFSSQNMTFVFTYLVSNFVKILVSKSIKYIFCCRCLCELFCVLSSFSSLLFVSFYDHFFNSALVSQVRVFFRLYVTIITYKLHWNILHITAIIVLIIWR